jgi:YVTN family beta-propeller protein
VQAAGGALPYSWTLLSGSLPTGFSPLSSTGVISGTATVANTYTFTVQVTDAGGHTATQALSLTINPATTVTLESIVVTPVDPTLVKGAIQPFIATGIYSDGSTQNLTSTVTWSSGTATVATINSSGVATGVGAGTSTIGATLGNVFGSTTLTVTASHLYAYIGSVVSANCCLDVLDTTNDQVVATIPLTNINAPFGITPDQSRLYVADNVNNIVDVVDTATNTLLTTIATGLDPTEVVITPNGQFGYVATFGETNVGVFSVASNTVVATIPVGLFPYWLTPTPDGSLIYVTATAGNSVAVISTSTNTVSSTFSIPVLPGETSPSCISSPVFNPAGTLVYFLQQPSCSTSPATANGVVNVLSLPGNTPVATIPVGVNPFGSVMSPDGTRLYVVNFGSTSVPSNSVSVIDTATNAVVATVAVGNRPGTIGITPDGTEVYVTSASDNAVTVIQTSTNTVVNTIPLTVPFGILIPSPPVPSQAPVLTLTPSYVTFNALPLGFSSGAQTINVVNPGPAPLTLTNIGLTGPNTSSFSLSSGCPAPPATLAVGGAGCNIQVSFTPLTASTLTALVAFNFTNGEVSSQQSVPLSGTGVTSAATVLPTALTFGSQTVSTTSAPQAITISSNGTGQFVISSIVVTGTNPGDFPLTTNCPIGGVGLATGTSCGIFVSFAPTDLGARTASVVVTDNQGNVNGSQQTVTLTGTGADVPVVASTTYTFTGNPFTTFTGAVTCPPDCNINGFFTVAQPLAPNLSNVRVSALNYAAYVGNTTFTPANTTSGGFASISTDASGNIIAWSITLSTSAASFSTVNLPTGSSDTFTQVSPLGTASNAGTPGTWPTTTVTPLSFPVSTTPVSNVVSLNCPSGTVPCTDANAHSFKLTVPAVSTAFTLTVTAFQVPLSQANGDCPAGQTEATNFNCRFVTYFNLGSDGNGGTLVPQCVPYADGNCVFYRVSNTPPDGTYTQGISEYIAWNNTSYTPSSFYNASNPQLYDDPDSPPYDINHQFVFDITQYFVSGGGQVGVDPGISGSTKKFNDFVVAYPQAQTNPYTATVLSPLGTPSVTTGATLPVAITLQQNSAYTGNALVAPNVVSIGVLNSSGVRQPTIDPVTGVAALFVYNSSAIPPQYQLNLSTQGYAPGTYQLFINSNLFSQLVESFTVTAPVTLQSLSLTPLSPSIVSGATVQFTATGHYSDGSTQNLTSTVSWSSSLSTVATISSTGLATGAGTGNATITATTGNIFAQTVLTVTGAPPPTAMITINPASLTFANQIVSTTSAQMVINVSSTGTAPLVISSIAVTGTNPGDFPLLSNCPIGGEGIAPGAPPCGIFVSFAPTDLGARTASVTITDNQNNITGSQQSVPLSGTGVDVPVVASTTYSITGNPFAFFSGSAACPPDCNITGSFTLAQPLAPNLSLATITPTSFSFSVGPNVLNQSNATTATFNNVSTDASGNIITWSISLSNSAVSVTTVNLPTGSDDIFTQVSPQGTATNAGTPGTWPKTTVTPLSFPVSATPVSNVVPLNCPSGTVPCTDPNAHSFKLTIPAVSTAFTLTVTSVEVPLSQANGDCPAGQTEATNFNCRFVTYFNLGSDGNGGTLVPQCVPYSNGNCVFYRVSNTPPDGTYTQGISEYIAWNNTSFTPSSFYNASNPQLYDDPDSPPYDINHQFVFDITQYFVSGGGQVGVDPGISGSTKKFNDFVVAYPQAQTNPYTATVLSPLGTPSVTTGATLPVAFTLQQNSAYTGNALVAPNVVSIGVVNSSGVHQPALDPATGVTALFVYNSAAIPPQYQLNLSTQGYAPGTYQLFINSNLFSQLVESFTVTAPVTLQTISVTPAQQSIAVGATQQFTATGHYSDGSTQNLTSSVTWTSNPTTVATINATGLATAAGPGAATISASLGTIITNTTLVVTQSAPPTAIITINPGSLAFANQIVSTTSAQMVINVSSTGTAPLVISSITVTGTNPGDFPETTNCPIGGAGLAPGAPPCGIFVSFAPTDLGARTASVTITDNQNNITGSQQSVPLRGTGVDVAVVASTTYNITGNPFTFYSGSAACPPDCNITGSFTLAQPLAPNLSLATITPTSFSFSVGPNVLNQSNATTAAFNYVSTDGSGNITGWYIDLASASLSIVTSNVDGKAADSFQVSSPQGSATNSGSPSTWPKTTVTPLSFPVSTTPVSNVVSLNCPSGTVPCTDPNAHSFKLTIPAVSTAFTLTVTSFEVPLSQANGDCPAGQTEATNFNCRFVTYFDLGSDGNGGTLVPQCVPYSNGNCVFYRVSNTPPDGTYTQGIGEFIAWNNTSFTPSSFYDASNPRLYDDPDSPPYDINHQFVFDITQYFVSGGGQVGVDPGISGSTKKFNDFVVAYPKAQTNPYTATVITPLGDPSTATGTALPVAFTLQQSGSYTGNALVAPNVVSIGVVNSSGVHQPALDPATGVTALFVYNSSANPPQYQLNLSTQGYAPGTYQLFINSNLFTQLVESFTVTAAGPFVTFGLPSQNAYSIAKGSGGSYLVTVNFVNKGNVTVNSCTLTSGTLGSAAMTSYSMGPCTNVVPGQSFTLNVTFPSSAGAGGAGVPLQLKGTYTAGTLSGNWSETFRKIVLPSN